MNTLIKLALATAALALAPAAAIAESSTVRILHDEPYGAIVTKEAGVLVFRGLPPTRKVIVNPDAETPLVLESADVTKTYKFYGSSFARTSGAKVIELD